MYPPDPKDITRINIDALLLLSMGAKINVNICRVNIDQHKTEGRITDRMIVFACFDLPPMEN